MAVMDCSWELDMRIEARVMKRYLFRERQTMPGQCGYAFVVMESADSREAVLFYIKADNREDMIFIKRLEGCTLDDTDRHLKEIESIGDSAVKKFEETYGVVSPMAAVSAGQVASTAPAALTGQVASTAPTASAGPVTSTSTVSAGPVASGASASPTVTEGAASPAPLKPMPRKRVISAEEEEREKAKSLAMLQKNSMIDYRYNRKGDLIKTLLEGSEKALTSDLFSVISLINRRMADDIRPILLSMLPYYHNNDFDMEYELTKNKETTIRYVVNENGLITACTVNGAKYPLYLTILMIFRQLAENAEDGMDAFHERIMNRMNSDMEREKKFV